MKQHKTNFITLFVFLTIIFTFTIANIFSPKLDFSPNENRYLTKFPSLSIDNILSGKFDDEFESWFSDHFIARDMWIQTKAISKLATGSIENNDIYLGKDNHLISSFHTYNKQTLENNLSYIEEFAQENNITAHILPLPTAAYSDEQYLPRHAFDLDQEEIIKEIQQQLPNQDVLDLSLDLKNQDAYFKTDHHWNEKGAKIAYDKICKEILKKEPEEFTTTKVSSSFYGTLYSKSGMFWLKPDDLYRIDPIKPNTIQVTFEDGSTMNSCYSDENLLIKDAYTYYFDGNHARVNIQTGIDNHKKAVIIKDSYAHILLPYLVQEYSEIEVLDLRYYRDAVSKYVDETTDVYFIYSLDTLTSDKNLAALW